MVSRVYADNLDSINPLRRDEVNRICKYLVLNDKAIVRRLVVFGSSTTDRTTEDSDVDIAVEFFVPEVRYGDDGQTYYERKENNSFLSWARAVTLECGMSLVDIDNLRTFPAQYFEGIEDAVENGIVVYESNAEEVA